MNLKRYLKVKMLNLQQEVQLLLSVGGDLAPNALDTIAADIDDLTDQVEELRKGLEGKGTEPSIDEKPAKKAKDEEEELEEVEGISLEELLNQLVNESSFTKERVSDFELLKKKRKQ
jgi:uncharacterized membrane protein YukC